MVIDSMNCSNRHGAIVARVLFSGFVSVLLSCNGMERENFSFLGQRSYVRDNTWNGCVSYGFEPTTRFEVWHDCPLDICTEAVHFAIHHARYCRNAQMPIAYYHDPIENGCCDQSEGMSTNVASTTEFRLNLNKFAPLRERDFKLNGVLFSKMDIKILPFRVTNPSSKIALRCVLVSFWANSKFQFAIYFNVNEGVADLDFHTIVGSGGMLVAAESRYPYLTSEECKTQAKVHIDHFKTSEKNDNCVCRTCTISYETIRSRVFSMGLRNNHRIVFSETACSTARTDFAVHSVLNHLRYNNNREIIDARVPQFWTEGSWPQVPPLDYAIDGVKICDMRIQTFHFSVRHPDVRDELSMFLITFLSGDDFKLAMYFNENIGRVGFTFEEAAACNLRFRLITDYPYLNEKEEQKQKEVLGRMWQESPKSKPPFPNVNIGTNDVKVTVDL